VGAAARWALTLVVLVVAAVAQVVLVDPLRLPGASPDLVLLVVFAFALAGGPRHGALVGFVGGLLVDLTPPSDGYVGVWALAFTLVGAGVGQLAPRLRRSVVGLLSAVAVAAGGSVVLAGLLARALGNHNVAVTALGRTAVAAALYDVLLSPFVVLPVFLLARRVEPAAVRERSDL